MPAFSAVSEAFPDTGIGIRTTLVVMLMSKPWQAIQFTGEHTETRSTPRFPVLEKHTHRCFSNAFNIAHCTLMLAQRELTGKL